MHDDNFRELSNIKILIIHNVRTENNTVIAELTTAQFNRVTTKPYWFNYKDYLKTIEKMYIGE